MKRRTRIISAVCAAALLGSAMTMPAAAYPMHMNGEAEVPLAQVLQMLENDKTAYVEKGESMYYGLKDPTPVGMYDNIFYATAEQDDLIQLNEYAYRIQLEQDVADVRELTEQLCGLLTKKENAEEPTADQALSTEESETRQLTMTAEGNGAYTLRFSTSSYRLDEEKLCQLDFLRLALLQSEWAFQRILLPLILLFFLSYYHQQIYLLISYHKCLYLLFL